jgi:hypothetical protein
MKSPTREPRRPNLATIVGSGLAVVAAGSLLAFSTLAEQAGLEGLATHGLQPAGPGRGGETRAIRIPAPATAPPAEPPGPIERIVRDAATRVAAAPARPALPPVATTPPAGTAPERPKKTPPHRSKRARRPSQPVALARSAAPAEDAETDWDGPPYGHAHGHDKKAKKPKKHAPKGSYEPSEETVYARTGNHKPKSSSPRWKPPKTKKVEKKAAPKSHGRGLGHTKHEHSQGKGKGHAKHGH